MTAHPAGSPHATMASTAACKTSSAVSPTGARSHGTETDGFPTSPARSRRGHLRRPTGPSPGACGGAPGALSPEACASYVTFRTRVGGTGTAFPTYRHELPQIGELWRSRSAADCPMRPLRMARSVTSPSDSRRLEGKRDPLRSGKVASPLTSRACAVAWTPARSPRYAVGFTRIYEIRSSAKEVR